MSRPEILYFLFSPVTAIKGVGESIATHIARLFARAEGERPIIRDLLFHLPVGLIDRRVTFPLREAQEGVVATFTVTIHAHQPPPHARFSRKPYKVICGNETGDLILVFFNASNDYIKRALPIGETRVISGRVERFDFHTQITHPDVIALPSQLASVQTVEPVYPLTAGLTNRRLASIIASAISKTPDLPEWIPEPILAKHPWHSWRETLLRAHAPKEQTDLDLTSPLRERLAFDEIFANQLHLALLRSKMQSRAAHTLKGTGLLRNTLLAALPFQLTQGQQEVLREIDADMSSGSRMVRLLQGDVGSGKTIVALLAALTAAENSTQTAIMVPTEIIAQQHFATIRNVLKDLPVQVSLLTGSVKGKAREEVLEQVASGKTSIIVGTHALFQEAVNFHDLGLIVIDEQHRFGVSQRMMLMSKGNNPHLLQMSATPIPRSLTMTLYGDMDVSLLTEKPAGRTEIVTRALSLSRFDDVTERLRHALATQEKIYWICPLIEDTAQSFNENTAAAEARYTMFKHMFGAATGMVHGRMKQELREKEMQRFATGDSRLLVATTVVEVGVDVKDATIIVIEQAERFGLAQLHQLRGRVGRGDKPSSCLLLYSDGIGEEGLARLSSLRDTSDGFRIAEEDLRLRGGGDLLGTRQSGLPQFYFLDLVAHRQLIGEARECAVQNVTSATLASPEGKSLQLLLALYGYEYGI